MPPARTWRTYPQTYRLEAARCKKCGKVFFPPRLVCSEFSGEAPFAVGIVQIDDGARLTTQIADVPFEEIKIGMPVKLEFRRSYSEGEAGIIHYGHKAVPLRE